MAAIIKITTGPFSSAKSALHVLKCINKPSLFQNSKPPNLLIRSNSNFSRSNELFCEKNKTLVGLGIASLSICGISSAWMMKNVKEKQCPKVYAAEPWEEKGTDSPRTKWNFIADVVDKTAHAVVHIEIQGRHPFTGKMTAISNGSGFIVREDGLILTNAHVVANKSNVKVRLHNDKIYTGHVQAVDPVSDLATIKVDATGLSTIKLGKSSDLRPGEWVVALGSPFQLSNTVTAGIVSTPCRGSAELGLHNKDMEYVQTDAVINDGEAIGINTMKVTTGISFAIPSDYAKSFLEKANTIEKRSEKSSGWFGSGSKTQTPKKRYLGVTMLTLTPSLIEELKARQEFPDVDHGVLIYRVVIGSPAYEGGIRAGDIVLKINGKEIRASTDIYKAVDTEAELKMNIQRGTDFISLNIKPEEMPL